MCVEWNATEEVGRVNGVFFFYDPFWTGFALSKLI